MIYTMCLGNAIAAFIVVWCELDPLRYLCQPRFKEFAVVRIDDFSVRATQRVNKSSQIPM